MGFTLLNIVGLIIVIETTIIIIGVCEWYKIKCNFFIHRHIPSFSVILVFIPFCCILSTCDETLGLELSILFFMALELIVFVISYMLFPRIVVTIDNNNQNPEFVLWADGKKIYEKEKNGYPIKNFATRQFTFQVWRKGKYDLYLEYNKDSTKSEIKSVNTYDHHVCHVRFDKKRK